MRSLLALSLLLSFIGRLMAQPGQSADFVKTQGITSALHQANIGRIVSYDQPHAHPQVDRIISDYILPAVVK